MFLRSAKNLFSSTGSISGQLTFLYSGTLFILITVSSFIFYLAMVNILYEAAHQFLADEIVIIQDILENKPGNTKALEQEVEDVPNALRPSVYHYYIRVLDKKNVIAVTSGMDKSLQNNQFFTVEMKNSSTNISQWWQSPDNKNYLLMQSTFTSIKDNNSWQIQAALDVSYQQNIIKKYRKYVYIIILFGGIFSVLIGYFISRKGMLRLSELTEKTKKITGSSLQQRIDPELWPKELKELGKAYNQMLDRIEFSINRLKQFSDDLAHELRTPINNLMGEAEVALSHVTTEEEYRNVIGSSLEELNRIYKIIENLLFLARAENPKLALEKAQLNVKQEIEVMCRYYEAVADEKNIKLHCKGNAKLHANMDMFRRMIGNLISNAIKYSKYDSEVKFDIKTINNEIQITISDNGIGISEQHLPHVFQRFYRTSSEDSESPDSNGLGLAIVKSIVELHQGTITIESKPNKGTSITINLPK